MSCQHTSAVKAVINFVMLSDEHVKWSLSMTCATMKVLRLRIQQTLTTLSYDYFGGYNETPNNFP